MNEHRRWHERSRPINPGGQRIGLDQLLGSAAGRGGRPAGGGLPGLGPYLAGLTVLLTAAGAVYALADIATPSSPPPVTASGPPPSLPVLPPPVAQPPPGAVGTPPRVAGRADPRQHRPDRVAAGPRTVEPTGGPSPAAGLRPARSGVEGVRSAARNGPQADAGSAPDRPVRRRAREAAPESSGCADTPGTLVERPVQSVVDRVEEVVVPEPRAACASAGGVLEAAGEPVRRVLGRVGR